MSTKSNIASGRTWHISDPEFDPANGALQVGHREMIATMSGVPNPITMMAWAIGFDGQSGASVRYADIKTLLGAVGGDGLVSIRLKGITGNQFGSMSERSDLVGEASVTWVAAIADLPDARGAVLAVLNGTLVQILAVTPYDLAAPLRSTYLLESIAANMEVRSPQQFATGEVNRTDLMDRLPALDDLPLVLRDGTILAESFHART